MTDYTELIKRLRIYGTHRDKEAADALEQAQARIAELEAEVADYRGKWLQEFANSFHLALQVEQMREALAEQHRINLNNYQHDPDDYENTQLCAQAEAALAISTAPASEVIAAHDAKVIERTFGKPVGEMSAGTFVHWANDLVPAAGTKLYAIRALIAAPKENSNV